MNKKKHQQQHQQISLSLLPSVSLLSVMNVCAQHRSNPPQDSGNIPMKDISSYFISHFSHCLCWE